MAAIDYADAIALDRLAALVARLDAAPAPGVLRFYAAPRPSAGATAGSAPLVATVILPRPLVADLAGRTLTLAAIPDAMATLAAFITWARWEDGAGTWCLDCDVAEGDPSAPPAEGDAPIIIDSASVLPGGLVRVLSAVFEE